MATFNQTGGSANASDYSATVTWGDGSTGSSSGTNPALTITVSGGLVTVSGNHTYSNAGLAYPAVTLAYQGASVSTNTNAITLDVAADVTSHTSSSSTPYYRNPITKVTTSTLTLTNKGSTSLSGEFYLVLQGLTSGVTLQSATITIGTKTYTLTIDTTSAGDPMIVIPSSVLSSLASGKSFQIALAFNNPSNYLIKYTTKLYSDPYDTL